MPCSAELSMKKVFLITLGPVRQAGYQTDVNDVTGLKRHFISLRLPFLCRTFSELSKPADLYKKCEELCESLADDLTEEEMKVRITHCKNC